MGAAIFMIFLTVFIGVFLGVHYYLYFSATKDFTISSKMRFWIRMFLLLSALSYVAARMLERRGIPMGYALRYGSVWMGFVSVSFSIFVVKDIIGLFLKKQRKLLAYLAVSVSLALSG
ncbi:MAG TPA: hypothetical protein ENN55_01985, partial [Firmicutes bacterium]|nr:hypothetical protein [Bacillota bacterium]